MFLQWVLIRSPCFATLTSSSSLFSSRLNPRFSVLRERDGSKGSNSSRVSIWSSSRVFPWYRNSFFRTSTFFRSRFRLLFADDPNSRAMFITFSRFSGQQCYPLFFLVVHRGIHNLVFQHVDDCHHREGDQPGSSQHLGQPDSFSLCHVVRSISSLLS